MRDRSTRPPHSRRGSGDGTRIDGRATSSASSRLCCNALSRRTACARWTAHPRRLDRARRTRRLLLGGPRGRGRHSRRRGMRPHDARDRARVALPGGREQRRRRAVRHHGSDDERVRPARRAPPTALSAGHDRGIRRDTRWLSLLRHRLRHQPRGLGRRLRHRSHRGVHGLSHDRRMCRSDRCARRRNACASTTTRWHGYLANLSESEFSKLASSLPAAMSGAEFLRQYDGITDPVTRVRPELQLPRSPSHRTPSARACARRSLRRSVRRVGASASGGCRAGSPHVRDPTTATAPVALAATAPIDSSSSSPRKGRRVASSARRSPVAGAAAPSPFSVGVTPSQSCGTWRLVMRKRPGDRRASSRTRVPAPRKPAFCASNPRRSRCDRLAGLRRL